MRYRQMLKSKIHRATLTSTELDYEGSITIDRDLLSKADILRNEQVHVLNIDNGSRFVTYAMAAPAGSGEVILNGAAYRLFQKVWDLNSSSRWIIRTWPDKVPVIRRRKRRNPPSRR